VVVRAADGEDVCSISGICSCCSACTSEELAARSAVASRTTPLSELAEEDDLRGGGGGLLLLVLLFFKVARLSFGEPRGLLLNGGMGGAAAGIDGWLEEEAREGRFDAGGGAGLGSLAGTGADDPKTGGVAEEEGEEEAPKGPVPRAGGGGGSCLFGGALI
jgi:hypothetical protein